MPGLLYGCNTMPMSYLYCPTLAGRDDMADNDDVQKLRDEVASLKRENGMLFATVASQARRHRLKAVVINACIARLRPLCCRQEVGGVIADLQAIENL
jgi:hypothetical protein